VRKRARKIVLKGERREIGGETEIEREREREREREMRLRMQQL
jgi:hypothetical protein